MDCKEAQFVRLATPFIGGGDEEMPGPAPYQQQPMQLKYAKFSNAYMLVYVRLSDWPTIMCDVTKNDISKHLLDRLEVRAGLRS